jgi:hypothetical protein
MTKRRAEIVFDCGTANDPIDPVDGSGVGVRNTDFESSSVSKMMTV